MGTLEDQVTCFPVKAILVLESETTLTSAEQYVRWTANDDVSMENISNQQMALQQQQRNHGMKSWSQSEATTKSTYLL